MSLSQKWEAYKRTLELGETPLSKDQLTLAQVSFFAGSLAFNEEMCKISEIAETHESQQSLIEELIVDLHKNLDEALLI